MRDFFPAFARRLAGPLCAGLVLVSSLAVRAQLQLSITADSEPLITVTGPTGAVAEVQWSDSLSVPGRWFYLTNRTLSSAVQVSDPGSPAVGARFYRAVLLPDTEMVLIPGGGFLMGDNLNDGFTNEKPVHAASVSSFYLQRTELGRFDWSGVYLWALGNGYAFDNEGGGKGPTHPVHSINWYDAVKWCNAQSEMDGRTPCYYTDAAQTAVYRTGRVDLTSRHVRWSANGYRLPTEMEWERAARSGESGWRFPWGSDISFADANYFSTPFLSYDLAGGGNHPAYTTNDPPYTSPVGSFPPTAYGLSDLVGNVWEWCWDRFDPAWYANPAASQPNTPGSTGPTTNRVMRGGSWADDASFGRCANRAFQQFQAPGSKDFSIGFRYAMALPGFLAPAELDDAAALPGGAFRFTLYNLTPGKTNIVETSTNLSTWTALATNVPTTAVLNFTNTAASSPSGRYFRSRQLP